MLLTTNDAATLLLPDLEAAGAETVAVVDAREGVGVTGVLGDTRVSGVVLSDGRRLECDTLLVSGGWNPAVHLFSQGGGKLRYDDGLGAFVPSGPVDGVTVVGSASGALDEGTVLRQSRVRAEEVVRRLGATPTTEAVGPAITPAVVDPGAICWSIRPEGADPTTLTTHFVDLQRDATVADIARAVGAGMSSVEHVKRYTTIGTAHDQGKTSGVLASGIVSEITGLPLAQLGTTTHRPPYAPVPFAALAGRDRGDLYEPVRVTAVHDWHVAHGAEFEPVGQWLRPRHYPLDGESMDDAVRRETAAVRAGVGILDGSTLGTIDVQGPDAGVFLDLLYTNLISSLKPGMVRYGVMCGVDGMVIDDGTVMRLEPDRFIVFTTTGGAAKILDWMEEWLQTEWPQLRVRLCSLTDHWATFPVVGPQSRALIGSVFADVDVSNEAFPFMAVRETSLGGVPVRLARVSFSGELAYEVNVDSRYALDLWEILIKAGAAVRTHPVRHRDDARAAGREGLSDHRPGHRRHRHPPRSGAELGGVEEEDRLHRQAVAGPTDHHGTRPSTAGRVAAHGSIVRADRRSPARHGGRVRPGRGPPAGTGGDARVRHVVVRERRPGTAVRPGPAGRRLRADRLDPDCRAQRGGGSGPGDVPRPL